MKLTTRLPLLAALLVLLGCNDFLAEEPEDFLSPDNFPVTEADLRLALGGIDNWYTGGTNQPYFIRGWPMITEVPSDQTVYSRPTDPTRYEQDTYTFTPANEWLWRVWRQIYGAINQANIIIERVPQMTAVPQAVKNRYLGAALFHRAFNHLNAARVWGSVPLILAPLTDFGAAARITRAPIESVYVAIAADLEEAATLLPLRWLDSATPDDGRPTQGAAYAMLADVYMNMSGVLVNQNRWADAARAAKAVIDSNRYSLVPNFSDLWLIRNKNGPEHIYSIQFEGTQRNLFTCQSRPAGIGVESCTNYWYTTAAFMSSFDSLDARKGPTFLTQVNVPLDCTTGAAGCVTYYYDKPSTGGTGTPAPPFGNKAPRFPDFMPYYGKFFDANGSIQNSQSQRTDLNWPIYRYAEVLLMFAEAENEANGPTQAALNAINLVRRRAALQDLTLGLSQDSLRTLVRKERGFELAFESKRLFDLKRWGTFFDVLSQDPVAGPRVQPYHVFLAIPQREIDLAPGLAQNPGY
jgi:starch-binding outer membrane protein, SusD/RagB family